MLEQKNSAGGDGIQMRANAGQMARQYAKDLTADTRVAALSLRSLGALVMMSAYTNLGLRISSNKQMAAATLRVTQHVFEGIHQELTACQPPLIGEENGFLVVNAFGEPVKKEVSQARSLAAQKRWGGAKPSAGQAKEDKEAKAPKRRSKKPATATPVHLLRVPDATSATGATGAPGGQTPTLALPPQQALFDDLPIAHAPAPERTSRLHHVTPQLQAVQADEIDGDVPRRVNTPYARIASLFIEHCPSLQAVQQVSDWSEYRKEQLRSRWATHMDLDWWKEFFQRVEKSDFLCRRRGNSFKATFDWLLKPTNFQKVINGNFDNGDFGFKPSGLAPSQFRQGTYGSHETSTLKPWEKRNQDASRTQV